MNVQPENAELPIDSIFSGIVTFLRAEQSFNTFAGIDVMLVPKVTLLICPFNVALNVDILILSLSHVKFSSLAQPVKGSLVPTVITPLPMVTLSRSAQLWNA